MNLKILAAAAILSAIASGAARADPVDMSTITCAQLLQQKTEEVSFILTWVAGYDAGTKEELSMDPDALGKVVADTITYCNENQEMSVLNALTEVSAK